jgi:cytochrome c556
MNYDIIARLTLAATMALAGPALAQDGEPPGRSGWTGITAPENVIAARQTLMLEMERLMRPIDGFTADEEGDPAELRDSAEIIAAMLLATPHLFPPTTNRYDPDAEIPETLALPAIWEEFTAFYGLSAAATAAAKRMTTAEARELRDAAGALRASCDACHAVYLRPYVPAQVTDEDLDFDFDSLFSPD